MSKKNAWLYYLKKLAVFLLSVFVLTTAVFFIARMTPGDPLVSYYGDRVEKMSEEERNMQLTKTLIESFNMTLSGLIAENAPISDDTFKARNSLILSLCGEVN